MLDKIEQLLLNKRQSIEPNEEQKAYIRAIIKDIAKKFPMEWSEVIDEIIINNL